MNRGLLGMYLYVDIYQTIKDSSRDPRDTIGIS